jgi:DnaK suppressor protein
MPKAKSYTKKDLKEFKVLLLSRRDELLTDVERMESEVLAKTRDDAATKDISDFADLGTENFEQEFTLGLIESEEEELKAIERALMSIKSGKYGRCVYEGCKTGLIPKVRLRAIPYTNLCIECKKKIEEEGEKF